MSCGDQGQQGSPAIVRGLAGVRVIGGPISADVRIRFLCMKIHSRDFSTSVVDGFYAKFGVGWWVGEVWEKSEGNFENFRNQKSVGRGTRGPGSPVVISIENPGF